MIPTRIPGTYALDLSSEHVHFHFTKPITHKDQVNIQTLRVASANQPPPSSIGDILRKYPSSAVDFFYAFLPLMSL